MENSKQRLNEIKKNLWSLIFNPLSQIERSLLLVFKDIEKRKIGYEGRPSVSSKYMIPANIFLGKLPPFFLCLPNSSLFFITYN